MESFYLLKAQEVHFPGSIPEFVVDVPATALYLGELYDFLYVLLAAGDSETETLDSAKHLK